MTNKTFRIGVSDYELHHYIGNSNVRLDKIPSFGEIREKGKLYESEALAIDSIRLEAAKGFKKYILTISEALEVAKNIVSLYHLIDSRKSGYVVILSKKEPSELTRADESMHYYCRGRKAADEFSLDTALSPTVTDTTNYNISDMFYLDNGMSWERYMST